MAMAASGARCRRLDRLRHRAIAGRDAKTQAKRLLDQAKLDAENAVKQAELDKKEKLLKLQSTFDAEVQKTKTSCVIASRRSIVVKKPSSRIRPTCASRKSSSRTTSESWPKRLEETSRRSEEYARLIQHQTSELQRITGL